MQNNTLVDGRVGYVYFIQVQGGGPVKIGWSVDVHERLSELQTGCPLPLEIRRTIETTDRTLEKRIHQYFKDLRIRGEWFDVDPELDLFMNTTGDGPKPKPRRKPKRVFYISDHPRWNGGRVDA